MAQATATRLAKVGDIVRHPRTGELLYVQGVQGTGPRIGPGALVAHTMPLRQNWTPERGHTPRVELEWEHFWAHQVEIVAPSSAFDDYYRTIRAEASERRHLATAEGRRLEYQRAVALLAAERERCLERSSDENEGRLLVAEKRVTATWAAVEADEQADLAAGVAPCANCGDTGGALHDCNALFGADYATCIWCGASATVGLIRVERTDDDADEMNRLMVFCRPTCAALYFAEWAREGAADELAPLLAAPPEYCLGCNEPLLAPGVHTRCQDCADAAKAS